MGGSVLRGSMEKACLRCKGSMGGSVARAPWGGRLSSKGHGPVQL